MFRRYWPGLVALGLVLLFFWWLRPAFHGLVMFFYTSPIVWFPPLAILAIGFWGRRYRRPKLSRRDLELLSGGEGNGSHGGARRRIPSVGVGVVAGPAFFAFVLGAAFNGPLTGRAIYKHTGYGSISGPPEGGVVRLVPQEVAVQIASS